ncbi:hypothetical protein LTR62_001860 [Meristemomyces frigidus]|uniref:DUF3431 domain containing protein n=1 Tax=Meristemomyces frigidus TaxID=1508187 RepID=A0AAN7TAQ8_9PEZI|nr:hypothetical protein LTR62_001860 [Meristemomyces frigidus]
MPPDEHRPLNLLRFYTRRLGTSLFAVALTLVVATLLLVWTWPPALSAARSLNTPSGQPSLSIPQDTRSIERAVVIPKTRHDDVRWIGDLLNDSNFTAFVYSTDVWPEQQYLQPRTLVGREASAYLSYILDYYDALPKYSIFIHAAEDQWHNDVYSKATNQPDTLHSLRTSAIDAHGYINLRCKLHPGCPADFEPFAPGGVELQGHVYADFPAMYAEMFGVERQEAPESIGNICCAQFGVSRARILQRPKRDYGRMLDWARNTTELDGTAVGYVFEKLWHIVFGMDAVL